MARRPSEGKRYPVRGVGPLIVFFSYRAGNSVSLSKGLLVYGELVPLGGGDPIPLIRPQMRIGRREDCDVILKFSNVSGHHCVMTLEEGYWFIKDLNSSNGVKVNGVRLAPDFRKRVDPGDEVAIAKNFYKLEYEPTALGAIGPPPPDETGASIMGRSLLERAGLNYNRNAPGPAGQSKKLPPRRTED